MQVYVIPDQGHDRSIRLWDHERALDVCVRTQYLLVAWTPEAEQNLPETHCITNLLWLITMNKVVIKG